MQPDFLHFTHLELRNFRCFQKAQIDLHAPIVLIEGANGIGKTTVLEALHYACYLRSFRASSPKELIRFGSDDFFVKVRVDHTNSASGAYDVQVGFDRSKRLVRVDQRAIASYKELRDYVCMVSIAEDDLDIVREGPHGRRHFLDHILVQTDPDYASELRTLRHVIDNRNALLARGAHNHETYVLLTKQLWDKSSHIARKRSTLCDTLQSEVETALVNHFGQEVSIACSYAPKYRYGTEYQECFDTVIARIGDQERRYGRSLFGAHLDDVAITFGSHASRTYASRGQQKLVALLLKVASLRYLGRVRGSVPTLFFDDFMTDFDEERVERIIAFVRTIGCQLIFTTPRETDIFVQHLGPDALRQNLTY